MSDAVKAMLIILSAFGFILFSGLSAVIFYELFSIAYESKEIVFGTFVFGAIYVMTLSFLNFLD